MEILEYHGNKRINDDTDLGAGYKQPIPKPKRDLSFKLKAVYEHQFYADF